ncbi:MAG TPA: DUF4416 family protein [Thermodesulfovibrionales bacterium]|nr:DUF4416 family protein [Thermodesulfovibrionales bacterium]
MRKARHPERALLFLGSLYKDPLIFDESVRILGEQFGKIFLISPAVPWDHSSHYRDELGWPILRQFLFFEGIIDTGSLPDFKLKTIQIEDALSSGGKRRINLDPGYITLAKVVLASTKNYSHRIYMGKGIYAEVTLIYRTSEQTYTPHLFTYTDYQDRTNIDLFIEARNRLKQI